MLTNQQLLVLKADLAANTAVVDGLPINQLEHTPNNANSIAAWYNGVAVPDFWVWRAEADARQLMGDSGFDWTRVDNLSVGKARIWQFMMMGGTIDPSQPNIRAGFAACFSAVGDALTLASILGQCRRLATFNEKLFATGQGSTANPATVIGIGPLDGIQGVFAAWNLP